MFGRHFGLVSSRWNWQQEWIYFHDDDGRLASVPIDWTSLSSPDPFLVLSNGRARFRPDDLVRLADLIEGLWQGVSHVVSNVGEIACKGDYAATCKANYAI